MKILKKSKRNINEEKSKLISIFQNIEDYNVGPLTSKAILTKKRIFQLAYVGDDYRYSKIQSKFMLDQTTIEPLIFNCIKLSNIVKENVCEGYIIEFYSSDQKFLFSSLDGAVAYNIFDDNKRAFKNNVDNNMSDNIEVKNEKESISEFEIIISEYLSLIEFEGTIDKEKKYAEIKYRKNNKTLSEVKEYFYEMNQLKSIMENKILKINEKLGIDFIVQLNSYDNKTVFKFENGVKVIEFEDIVYDKAELELLIHDLKNRYGFENTTLNFNYNTKSIELTYIGLHENYAEIFFHEVHRSNRIYFIKSISNILKCSGNINYSIKLFSFDEHLMEECIDGHIVDYSSVDGFLNYFYKTSSMIECYVINENENSVKIMLSSEYSDLEMLYQFKKR